MGIQSQAEDEEETNSLSSSQSLLSHRHHSSYQTLDPSYEWNVEIDVKGQVDTGDTADDKFSFNKLLQYTGPGMEVKKKKSIQFNLTTLFRVANVSLMALTAYYTSLVIIFFWTSIGPLLTWIQVTLNLIYNPVLLQAVNYYGYCSGLMLQVKKDN